jgi:hypothetical protein
MHGFFRRAEETTVMNSIGFFLPYALLVLCLAATAASSLGMMLDDFRAWPDHTAAAQAAARQWQARAAPGLFAPGPSARVTALAVGRRTAELRSRRKTQAPAPYPLTTARYAAPAT